ncbi:putative sodium-coupled neutral amino acid transporter 11 isoform X1 [Danio rerio]|nr:putative sodium-coupled neutral amino acid transporter 11 isoform X1 [Danio rerio]XP_017213162.1 putative sodium-coupled neutral amino acid transporter 11 isoform X1 [Danio rerio]|eukprot:XP_009303252.1 putative sodium-coupled neutral amino acid transporter 11 isoform X1 [Danio rerio]
MENDKREKSDKAQKMESERSCLLSSHDAGKGGSSSVSSASFNFINSIIGSGIIGLPYSMSQAGLPMGLLLLILVAFITDYSIILLVRGGNLSGTHSYQSLVRSTFGQIGYIIVSVLQFLYPFIAMISYNIIAGDTLTKVFMRIPGVGPGNILTERHFVIAMSTVLFTLPLSLYRDIAKLGKVSLLSMILTFGILMTVVVRAATLGPQIPASDDAWVFARWNAIQAVAVMSFALICHHNSFMIYGSLQEPTLSRWSLVTHISVGSSVLVSAVFAAAGYATFTVYTQGDIFENYCRSDNLATFGRFCYGVSIITTFPLECFVTREVISNALFKGGELSKSSHVIITLVIISATTAISLSYDCLGIVLELNGILSAVPLMFIFPSACFLKLSNERWCRGENLIASMILVAGVFVMIIGLIMMALFPQDCSHGAEMFYCSASNTSSTASPSNILQFINTTQNTSIV